MSAAEDADLRSLSEDLARASQSASEPRCIALAFATPGEGELRLTMQQWIDLEAVQSPLLRGEAFGSLAEMVDAVHIFGLDAEGLKPELAVAITLRMKEALSAAFAMALPMQPPHESAPGAPDGFGAWLPLLSFLEADCHKARWEARAYPVGEAFALLAATRRNQGWTPKATTYAQRDVLKEGFDA